MRLIDAEHLKWNVGGIKCGTLTVAYLNWILEHEEPTIDAVPVRHGRWIKDPHLQVDFPSHFYMMWKCSDCGHSVDNPTPYCPWCGARMDAERKDND